MHLKSVYFVVRELRINQVDSLKCIALCYDTLIRTQLGIHCILDRAGRNRTQFQKGKYGLARLSPISVSRRQIKEGKSGHFSGEPELHDV